jgi:polysaccharide deacetylase family protein (PEP-CTERM system associated)
MLTIEKSLVTKVRKHILTIILEDYFQVGTFKHLIPSEYWSKFETHLKRNAHIALQLLADTNNRATFFTCGWIADNHPDILAEIIRCGHEVACQGYYHYAISEVSEKVFAQDLMRSRQALEDASGTAVHGFRIGRGWIGSKDLWALDILIEQGFSFDSSLCKMGTDFLNEPYRAVVHQHQGSSGTIHEIPVSTLPFLRWSIPISGGNYFRQFPPRPLQHRVAKWISKHSEPFVLYFHTWELDPEPPQITAASMIQRIRHYRNLATMPEKIQHYLNTYQFSSIAEYLSLNPALKPARQNITAADTGVLQLEEQNSKPIQPITVIIPCFNEADTLPYLKKNLDRFAKKAEEVFELHYILIDDGSTDDTWNILQQLFGEQVRCRLIKHEPNRGIASAILTGFKNTQTDLLTVLDADCTFAPEQLLEMIHLLKDDVDVVAASPAHEQGAMRNVSFFRSLMSRSSAFMYRCILNHKLTSYTSCFRLYRRQAVQNMKLYNSGFCGVAEILGRLDLSGHRIIEFPAVLEKRLFGRSKIKIIKTIWDHLKLIAHLAALRWFKIQMPEQTRIE